MHCTKTLTTLFLATAIVPLIAQGANHRQSFDELASTSDKVVVGTVGVRSSHWGNDSRIYTDIVISPDVTIKGDEDGAVTVRVMGGVVGDTRMEVSDGPDLPDDDRVILFLKRNGGHFTVVGRSAGSVAAASTEAEDALEGAFSQVERVTNRRLTNKRGIAGSFLHSRATRGTSTSTTSPLQQGCYNTDGSKWAVSSATYKIGSTIPDGWAASINASTATWNAAGAPFQLVNDPNSTNELSFADLVNKYGSSYNNTYAVTTTWSSNSTRRISRATIEINSKWQWSTSGEAGKADVQNILTHEFGHWMRLLDIYSPSTCGEVTMWGSATSGETKKRTLDQADIDGFKSLYTDGSTVNAPVLTAPANAANNVSTTPTLSWSAVSGATGYDVYFGNSSSPALATSVTGTSWQPGTLSAGVTYYWRVVAKTASSTASSNTSSFTTAGGDTGSSSNLTLLSPANGATGVSLTPVMAWTAVAGATAYDIYIGTSANPGRIGSTTSTAVTVRGFASGVTYYWRISARTPNGNMTSPVWSFQTR